MTRAAAPRTSPDERVHADGAGILAEARHTGSVPVALPRRECRTPSGRVLSGIQTRPRRSPRRSSLKGTWYAYMSSHPSHAAGIETSNGLGKALRSAPVLAIATTLRPRARPGGPINITNSPKRGCPPGSAAGDDVGLESLRRCCRRSDPYPTVTLDACRARRGQDDGGDHCATVGDGIRIDARPELCRLGLDPSKRLSLSATSPLMLQLTLNVPVILGCTVQ